MQAFGQYRGAIGETNLLVGSVGDLSRGADVLLKSVQETTQALNATIAQIDKAFLQPGKDPPAAAPGKPFDIGEYAQTALTLTGTLKEANALLAAAGGLLGASSDNRLEQATTRMLDSFLWRGMALIAWFFVLLLAYRFVASRLARK